MRPIRIAAQFHPQHGDYPALVAAVREADESGYDLAYNWDHFFPLYGAPDGAHLECWTVLGAWAQATRRIEIGPLVSCVSYRNPNLLADMARTVDRISGGRTVLGLGAGWFERDYAEYDFDFGTVGSRLTRLGDTIPIIQRRLEMLNPPPARRIPLLIGGSGERRTLRLVAQHADVWHAGFPDEPRELLPKTEALRRWCGSVGREPADIEWSVGVEPHDLDRFLDEDAPTHLEMGFTQFTLGFNGPSWPVQSGLRWLAWRDEQNRARITTGPHPPTGAPYSPDAGG